MSQNQLPSHDGGGSARATTLGENPGRDTFEPNDHVTRIEAWVCDLCCKMHMDKTDALDCAENCHELGGERMRAEIIRCDTEGCDHSLEIQSGERPSDYGWVRVYTDAGEPRDYCPECVASKLGRR